MNAQQAWQAVLGQLEMEMPRATFDTWVRETEFVAFADGTYLVAVTNEYARDWLESRLTSTCNRHLTGILNQTVSVQFTMSNGQSATPQPQMDEPDRSQPPAAMRLTVARDLQELFTKPDRALYFPGYWLRWIPYVGPAPFMTILAFRQALYQAEGCFAEGLEFEISAERVGEIIGIQRQTVARQRDEGKLDWFISHQKTEEYTFDSDGRPTRQPFRYAFRQSPITPADIDSVLEWLLIQGLDKQPLASLESAVAAQPRELIQFPGPRPTKLQLKRKPGTAQADLLANILSHCPTGMEPETRKEVVRLAGLLKSRLIESDGLVKVPLYFLNHFVPYLGISPALAVIVLRKKAYRNSQTGEIRETVRLTDGYAELASALGLSEGKIREFMPVLADDSDERLNRTRSSDSQKQRAAWVDDRRQRIQSLIRHAAKGEGRELHLEINTTDPLVPDHQQEFESALTLIAFLLEEATDPQEIAVLFDGLAEQGQESRQENDPIRTDVNNPDRTYAVDPNQPMGNHPKQTNGNRPIQPIGIDPNETDAKLRRFTKSNDIKVPAFKFLNSQVLKDLILQLSANLGELVETEKPSDSPLQIRWTKNPGKGWQFSEICQSAHIPSDLQKQLLANKATPKAFISHLLYAYSPAGFGLKNRIRYVISQLLRPGDGNLGYSPAHDRLASLTPEELQVLMRGSALSGYPRELTVTQHLKGAQDWQRIMQGHSSLEPIHEMGELLGLVAINF